ncbi:MAG: hypothetical protein WBC21_01445 [Minisyncoccales bacterium]
MNGKEWMKKYKELAEKMGVVKETGETQILATGFKAIEVLPDNFIKETQKFSIEKESKIQKKWNRQKRKAGKNLWNDPMASVVSFSIDVFGRLELVLRKSDYKTYVGTREKRFINTDDIPMDRNSSLPISMGAVTITSDDFIVLGLRSKTEAHRNELGLGPSGYLNPSVHSLKTEMGEIISVEELILCELYEELRIQTYIKKEYLALIQDMQPMIAVRLEIPFTKREMEQIAEINFEHSKFIYIENTIDEVKKAFREYKFTPHALSAILCHLL